MTKQYPNTKILLKALEILTLSQTEAPKFKVNLLDLSPKDQIESLRLFPLFCISVMRKSYLLTAEDQETIGVFYSLSDKVKLEQFKSIFDVLTEENQSQITETNLAELFTRFYFEFRGKINCNFHILLDKAFHIEFGFLTKNKSIITSFFDQTIDRLNQSQGPVPFMNLHAASDRIRGLLVKYSEIQGGHIHLNNNNLFTQTDYEFNGLYLPSVEALYSIQKHGEISICNIEAGAIEIGLIQMSDEIYNLSQAYNYDRQKGVLQIRGCPAYPVKSPIKRLMDIISSDPVKDWNYSEIQAILNGNSDENSEKDKMYYDKFLSLKKRIAEKTNCYDFFIFDSHSVKINSKYTD